MHIVHNYIIYFVYFIHQRNDPLYKHWIGDRQKLIVEYSGDKTESTDPKSGKPSQTPKPKQETYTGM